MSELLQVTYVNYPPDRFGVFDAMADAVMALLESAPRPASNRCDACGWVSASAPTESAPQPKVPQPEMLWTGPVGQLAASLLCKKPSARGWDPGTHVALVVIEDKETPADG